jgi:hypothetical protein
MAELAEQKAFQEGALVVLSIGKKSWMTKLTAEDLGLKPEELPKNWKPGRKLLLPEEALAKVDTLEGQSRRYLDSRSFSFGQKKTRVKYRFVHLDKLYDTLVTLENYREQYFKAVQGLITDYDKLKQQMATEYPDQWPKLEKLYPKNDVIEQEYYFTIEPVEMTFPTGMTAMQRHQLAKIDRNLKEAEAAKVENIAELRRDAEQHRHNLARMEQEQRAAAQTRVEQFVEEAVKTLRGKVVETFQGIAEKIRDKKTVIKSNIDSMKEVIAYVRDMDFLNDSAFHRQLDQVRTLLDTTTDFKDNAAATTALDQALKDTIEFVNKTTDEAAASAKKTYFARKLAI